jgi:CRISPR-associated protein Cas5d
MFSRRARAGQCFQQPYFGCREFPVRFSLLKPGDPLPESLLPPADRNRNLGYMLHDLVFDQDARTKAVRSATPRFFPAELKDGVLHVPPFHQTHS